MIAEPSPLRLEAAFGTTGLRRIDHAVVLNLDRREDRLDSFLPRAQTAGLQLVERVPGVDGRLLAPSPEIRHLFRGNDFSYHRGVLGCALSHFLLWQRIAEPCWPHQLTAVFEDDAMFCRDFQRLWNEGLAPSLPEDCDLIYLGGISIGHHSVEPFTATDQTIAPEQCPYVAHEINGCFGQPRRVGFGSYSYLIRPSAARILHQIALAHGIHRAIDWFIIDYWHMFRVCASSPLVCWSVIGGDTDLKEGGKLF